MKKIIAGFVTALLTVILCLTLAGCDKSDSIKKAFEDEGYTVTVVDTNNDTAKKLLSAALTQEQIDEVGKYGIYLCTGSGVSSIVPAMYIKFSSGSALKDFLTVEKDGKEDASAYDTAKEKGYINGNCYLLPTVGKPLEIFKNA